MDRECPPSTTRVAIVPEDATEDDLSVTTPGPDQRPIRVSVFGKTDLGKNRDHNEDSFLVADLSRSIASLQPDVREHDLGPKGTLLMVADGMGGAAAGEVASAMATKTVSE